MDKPTIEFDDIEDLRRNREIEGDRQHLGWPGDRWLQVLAATDANPRWRARQQKITAEINRLCNANAPRAKLRAYLAQQYAECLVIEWGGWKSNGVEIPHSTEAATALLLVSADDVFSVLDDGVLQHEELPRRPHRSRGGRSQNQSGGIARTPET